MKKNRRRPANRVLALIDSHQWLISDDWMETIRAIASRTNDIESFLANKELSSELNNFEALIPSHDGPVTGTNALRKGNVAIIPIIGPIFPRANLFTMFSGGASIETVARDTEVARAAGLEPVLYFSTPGGVVEGISDYAQTVAKLQLRGFVAGNCASAGYWIGSQCSQLIVSDTAIIGNIGVKGPNPGKDDAIVSDNAPNKKMTPKMVKGIVNDIETVFISAVASGRGVSVEHAIEHFGQGGVFVGQKAVDAGMADGVSTLEAMLNPSAKPARTKPREPTMAITVEEQAKIDKDLADAKASAKAEGVKEGQTAGMQAAQTRISEIMAIAPDKPLACHNLAFNSSMPTAEAKAIIDGMPVEAKKEPAPENNNDPLKAALDGTNPKIAANGSGGDDSEEEVTQADIDASWDDVIGVKA